MDELAKQIGERIRVYRKKKNLSQEQLAQLSDLHPKYISVIERAERNISLESIQKIAFSLGMNLEEFFKNSQPRLNADQNTEIPTRAYNLLNECRKEDQEFILDIIENLIRWKNQ